VRFVLATKYTLNMAPDEPERRREPPEEPGAVPRRELKRIGTDYIDLYWVHAWDGMTPLERRCGPWTTWCGPEKSSTSGSPTPPRGSCRGRTRSRTERLESFAALQIQYNLGGPESGADLLPMAKALDIAVTPWGVLAGGVLSGKYQTPKDRPAGARYSKDEAWAKSVVTDRSVRIAESAGQVAKETGRTASQVALAWVRQQPFGVIVPILGAKTVAQLQDNLGTLDITLGRSNSRSWTRRARSTSASRTTSSCRRGPTSSGRPSR